MRRWERRKSGEWGEGGKEEEREEEKEDVGNRWHHRFHKKKMNKKHLSNTHTLTASSGK
jgi:hypothetical protein